MALPENGYVQPVEIVVGGTLPRNGYVQPVDIVGTGVSMAIGGLVVGGTPGSILFVDAGGNLGQNNAAFFWDNTNLIESITTPLPILTTKPLNFWVDSTDPNAKKFALTLGDAGLWVNGSQRHDIVMNFGYNLGAQGPIDQGDAGWGLQFETFADRGAQLADTTGDVEFWVIYTEPGLGGFSIRPIGCQVDRTTHVSDVLLVATNYSFSGQSGTGTYISTCGSFSYGGIDPGSGAAPVWTVQGAAYTGITAGTEKVFVNLDDQTNQWTWAAGAIPLQRFVLIGAPTLNFNGASTVTTAASLYLAGAPVAGNLATITNPFVIATNNGDVLFDTGGGLVGMWWVSSTHTLKVMNSGTKFVTLAHDGTNSVLQSASGQMNVNAAANSTIQFGNNFATLQWQNANLQCVSDNLMSVGVAAKRAADVVSAALSATGANGQSTRILQLTELTTIAAAPTTATTIAIPANAIVLAVSVRVVTVIPTAATFTVTATTGGTTFNTAAVSTASTSTDPGTKAGAFYQSASSTITITPNVQPAAATGQVRVTIYYILSTAPTS